MKHCLQSLKKMDSSLLDWVQARIKTKPMDVVMLFFTKLGNRAAIMSGLGPIRGALGTFGAMPDKVEILLEKAGQR